MKKIFPLLISICISSFAHAGLWEKDTRVRSYGCDVINRPNPDSVMVWTFVVEKDSVIQKEEYYDEKKLKGGTIRRLDDCIVVDKKNWKCGGSRTYPPKGGYIQDRKFQVVNGKYFYQEMLISTYPEKPMFCKIEQVD